MREFSYWYSRVLSAAVPKFETLIINRINPMIRGMELEGLPTDGVAARLVGDYVHRNFVTAGGWALEQLAIAGSPRLRKSTAPGIDAEWHESRTPPVVNLYVIKSGAVTRNSDIVNALKTHGQEAQKRLIQSDKRAVVRVYYVVTAGSKTSTFEDGVYRPSSAEFWADAFAMDDENLAVELAVAIAQEAGRELRGSDGEEEAAARYLQIAVATYIATPADPDVVDWEFLAQATMIDSAAMTAERRRRFALARAAVEADGYTWPVRGRLGAQRVDELAEAAAELSPEALADIAAVLPDEGDLQV